MYGDSEQFLLKFNPSLQAYASDDVEKSIMRTDVPSLAKVKAGYGFGTASSWIIAQLTDLNDFIGVKRKMNRAQMLNVASIILQKFYYLKVTEMLVFFNNLKAGEYEMFYGEVDPQKILSSIYSFVEYRNRIIAKCDDEALQNKYKVYESSSVSEKEWKEIKQLESWTMWADFMLPKYWSNYD